MGVFGPNIKKMKNRGDVQGLVRILREHPGLGLEALYALKDLGRAEELTEVLLEHAGNPFLKVKTVEVLCDMRYTEGLRKATGLPRFYEEAAVRAVEALGKLGDIDGLLQALRVESPAAEEAVRKAVFDVIAETIDRESLVLLICRLLEDLKYGELEDKLNALFILQDAILKKRMAEIPPEVLEQVRSILFQVANEYESADVRIAFTSLCALIEINAAPEYLQPLIQSSRAIVELIGPILDDENTNPTPGLGLYYTVYDQTLRALSSFKNDDRAMVALEAIYEGRLLAPPEVSLEFVQQILAHSAESRKLKALCALASLGHPDFRERMEYLVNRGKAPKVLIDSYGQATYDDLRSEIGC